MTKSTACALIERTFKLSFYRSFGVVLAGVRGGASRALGDATKPAPCFAYQAARLTTSALTSNSQQVGLHIDPAVSSTNSKLRFAPSEYHAVGKYFDYGKCTNALTLFCGLPV